MPDEDLELPAALRETTEGSPWGSGDLTPILEDLHRTLNALSATLAVRDPATLPPPHQRVKTQGGAGWFRTGGLIWHPIDRWRVIVPVEGPEQMVFVGDPFQTFPGDASAMWPNEARALGQALMAAADWATNDLWRKSFERDSDV